MPLFKIDDLQLWTAGQWSGLPKKYPEIKGFTTDSRNVPANFAFVALQAKRDGHDFAADAIANGAIAVIASKPLEISAPVLLVKDTLKAFQTIAKFHRLRFEGPVVGITGSCGKTTTKEFLTKLLAWKKPLATSGNLNNEIGVPLTLTKIDLRENMCAIVEAGVSGIGQMKELANMIEPDLAIITSVTPAHMQGFAELANIAKEKALLAEGVANGGWALFHSNLLSWKAFEELPCKKAVLAPAETPEVRADLVFRYALKDAGDFVKLEMNIEGGNEYYFEIPHLSKGLTENALLAIAGALILGTGEEQILSRAETLQAAPMRGAVIDALSAKFYVDCYNASPASMKDSLDRFLKISENYPRIYVLGGMEELGISALRHHREIAEYLPLREGDKIAIVGKTAQTYKAHLLEKEWKPENIFEFEKASDAVKIFDKFEGFAFVKGSRLSELENSLPNEVREKLALAPQEFIPEEEIIEEIIMETSPVSDENDGEKSISAFEDPDDEFEEEDDFDAIDGDDDEFDDEIEDDENLRDESNDERF